MLHGGAVVLYFKCRNALATTAQAPGELSDQEIGLKNVDWNNLDYFQNLSYRNLWKNTHEDSLAENASTLHGTRPNYAWA
jgi:hypothetical protein